VCKVNEMFVWRSSGMKIELKSVNKSKNYFITWGFVVLLWYFIMILMSGFRRFTQ